MTLEKEIKEIFEKFESEYISLGYEKNRTSNDVFKMLDGIKSEILQKIKEYKKDIKNILNEIETLANQDCWDDERGNFRKEFLKKLKELRRKYDN
jgi:gas vesicle protein